MDCRTGLRVLLRTCFSLDYVSVSLDDSPSPPEDFSALVPPIIPRLASDWDLTILDFASRETRTLGTWAMKKAHQSRILAKGQKVLTIYLGATCTTKDL
jgi:hypothetical protein